MPQLPCPQWDNAQMCSTPSLRSPLPLSGATSWGAPGAGCASEATCSSVFLRVLSPSPLSLCFLVSPHINPFLHCLSQGPSDITEDKRPRGCASSSSPSSYGMVGGPGKRQRQLPGLLNLAEDTHKKAKHRVPILVKAAAAAQTSCFQWPPGPQYPQSCPISGASRAATGGSSLVWQDCGYDLAATWAPCLLPEPGFSGFL